MNVRLNFKRDAESWVRRIESEELSVSEQKEHMISHGMLLNGIAIVHRKWLLMH